MSVYVKMTKSIWEKFPAYTESLYWKKSNSYKTKYFLEINWVSEIGFSRLDKSMQEIELNKDFFHFLHSFVWKKPNFLKTQSITKGMSDLRKASIHDYYFFRSILFRQVTQHSCQDSLVQCKVVGRVFVRFLRSEAKQNLWGWHFMTSITLHTTFWQIKEKWGTFLHTAYTSNVVYCYCITHSALE